MTAVAAPPADPSLEHVLGRLEVLRVAVASAVAARQARADPVDSLRRAACQGDEQLDGLVGEHQVGGRSGSLADAAARRGVESAADVAVAAGAVLRLRRLADCFELAPLDVDLLLTALAPEVDSRFEPLYGYLHDDVMRWRASVGIALDLCAASCRDAAARARLLPGGPLLRGQLLAVGPDHAPFLRRDLVVPDRVVQHLLGDDAPDPVLDGLVAHGRSACTVDSSALAGALACGVRLTYVREREAGAGRALARGAYEAIGRAVLAVDLARPPSDVSATTVLLTGLREAMLRDAALLVGPVEALVAAAPAALSAVCESGWPIALSGAAPWDPSWSAQVPLVVTAPALPAQRLDALWREGLPGAVPVDGGTVGAYRLGADQAERAVTAAQLRATYEGRRPTLDDVREGVRSQNAAGLERHARRLEPRATWDDLVVPEPLSRMLRDLPNRLRWRDTVYAELGVRRGNEAVTAMFTGLPGTGKSMAAEVVAGDLGLDLYVVDLARVIDKYIGETEKNLDRVFSEAERVNGVLLFDEADALFGKRSEVRDAHDRYANVETAYLLQRLESFDGIAILTSNLANNLDDAFARRLDAVVEFPMPDESFRLLLWQRALGRSRLAPDVDLAFCAKAFELSGGHIRNVVVTAAFLAAARDEPVCMADLVHGTAREYRKLGRLCGRSEFGPYFGVLT